MSYRQNRAPLRRQRDRAPTGRRDRARIPVEHRSRLACQSGLGESMTTEHRRTYNLIAAFGDMTKAEQVIEDLKAEGVRGEHISLLGRHGGEIVTTDDRKTQDRETIGAAAAGTAAGIVGGGVLGGAAGFLLGLAAFAIPGVGPVVGAGLWAATALGALAGAEGGAFVGYMAGTELSSQRSEAYDAHLTQGHVLIGVSADDAAEFERAFNVVARSQPLEIDRYGRGIQTHV